MARNQKKEGFRSLGDGVRKKWRPQNRVRIDDVGSILRFRIGFPFGKNRAGFCKSVWLPGSILNFRIGSVSSIGGLIAATLFARFRFPEDLYESFLTAPLLRASKLGGDDPIQVG